MRAKRKATGKHTRGPRRIWANWPDDRLLDLRMGDLGLEIKRTPLQKCINQLYQELKRRDLRFRPHFWLSEEWFTPDGVPGVAIPFYLAHPRLMRLERKQMLEVEGGTHEWCMRILRHEVGHALDHAYLFHRRSRWRQLFGKSSKTYPDFYKPRPYSKQYVHHLDYWYAQSHPCEDFAETFAVWMGPRTSWRRRYQGWPALKKLEYVDELMQKIAGKKPINITRKCVESLAHIRKTLREHYEQKQARYEIQYPDFYDHDLRRLFSDAPEHGKRESAAVFLRRIRKGIRELVSRWTGEYQYTLDLVLREMIERARELNLRVARPEKQLKMDFAILLTVQIMNYLHSGRHRMVM